VEAHLRPSGRGLGVLGAPGSDHGHPELHHGQRDLFVQLGQDLAVQRPGGTTLRSVRRLGVAPPVPDPLQCRIRPPGGATIHRYLNHISLEHLHTLGSSRLGHPRDEDDPEGSRPQRVPDVPHPRGQSGRSDRHPGERPPPGQGRPLRPHRQHLRHPLEQARNRLPGHLRERESHHGDAGGGLRRRGGQLLRRPRRRRPLQHRGNDGVLRGEELLARVLRRRLRRHHLPVAGGVVRRRRHRHGLLQDELLHGLPLRPAGALRVRTDGGAVRAGGSVLRLGPPPVRHVHAQQQDDQPVLAEEVSADLFRSSPIGKPWK
jgi:hypothetical protein